MAAVLLCAACSTQKDSEKVNIEKQTVQLEGDLMTPEALWAMSRIGGYQASPDGKHIAFQMGYYSVKENKSPRTRPTCSGSTTRPSLSSVVARFGKWA